MVIGLWVPLAVFKKRESAEPTLNRKGLCKDVSPGPCCPFSLVPLTPATALQSKPMPVPSPGRGKVGLGSWVSLRNKLEHWCLSGEGFKSVPGKEGSKGTLHTVPTVTRFLPLVPQPGAVYIFLASGLQCPLGIIFLRLLYYMYYNGICFLCTIEKEEAQFLTLE